MTVKIIFGLLSFYCLNWVLPSDSATLVLDIHNIEQAKGYVWVGVYKSQENFLAKGAAVALEGAKIEQTGHVSISIKDLPYGTYAVALFHDVNSNGKLDQGVFGIPKEPYAFSQPLKSKWRAPIFDDVKFDVNTSSTNLKLKLEEWTW